MDNDILIKINNLLKNFTLNNEIINNLKIHLNKLLSDNIITFNKYNDIIDKIKFYNLENNKQLKSIKIIGEFNNLFINSENIDIDSITKIEENYNSIYVELIKIIFEYGYLSIYSTLYLIDQNSFLEKKNEFDYKLSQINKYFQIISIEKKNIEFKKDIVLKIKNLELKNIKNSEYQELYNSKYDNRVLINFIYELNKIDIELEYEENLFIFRGYFNEDILNNIYLNDFFENKYKKIITKMIISNKSNKTDLLKKKFIKEYLNQISIKDFIILEENEIINKLNDMYFLSKKINKLSVIDLLNEFIKSNIYEKRDYIIILLFNDSIEDKLFDEFINENLNNIQDNNIIFDIKDNNEKEDNNKKEENEKEDNEKENKKMSIVKFNKSLALKYSINSIKIFDAYNSSYSL
jgi:hypothetical protein